VSCEEGGTRPSSVRCRFGACEDGRAGAFRCQCGVQRRHLLTYRCLDIKRSWTAKRNPPQSQCFSRNHASSSHSADDDPQRGGASGVILRESPTTADPSGPCRERREPRWRSPALPVAGASLIDRCQQQHRGAIWPVGACRRLVDSCGDGSLELGGLGVEAVG
jgi:hypothetical protein